MTIWIAGGSGPSTSMPSRCMSSESCWNPSSTFPSATSVPTGTPGGACTIRDFTASAIAPALEQPREVRAARPGRIADGASRRARRAGPRPRNRCRAAGARSNRHRHAGPDEVDPASGHDPALPDQLVDHVGRQHHRIERLRRRARAWPRRRRRPTRARPRDDRASNASDELGQHLTRGHRRNDPDRGSHRRSVDGAMCIAAPVCAAAGTD